MAAKIDASLAHLEATVRRAAEGISEGLARDEAAYDAAIRRMAKAEPGVLDEASAIAAELNNCGPLKPGAEVEVVVGGGDGAKMAKARVVRADGNHGNGNGGETTYEVSMWKMVSFVGLKYEEGYDTSKPEMKTRVPRRAIYANRKDVQKLSPTAKETAERRAGLGDEAAVGVAETPTSPSFLALLYADAERTLPKLHELGEYIGAAAGDGGGNGDGGGGGGGVRPIVAPLKGEARASIKALEKYGGNYARLTDLARMTFECETLRDALVTLRALKSARGYEVLLVKDRLTLAFDASATGGYRDMLLNLRCEATGHIFEVQITLAPLLAIKAGGGHAAYQLARMHKLFEKATYRHEGAITERVLDGVRSGVIRELECTGRSVGLATHFDGLVAALAARSCGLRVLDLIDCDWPTGRDLVELTCVLPRGMICLTFQDMGLTGVIAPVMGSIVARCPQLEVLYLAQNKLSGALPPSVGKLVKLKELHLF